MVTIGKRALICAGSLMVALAASGQGASNVPRANSSTPWNARLELKAVTPVEADRVLKSRQLPRDLNAGFVAAPGQPARAAPVSVASSIPELARALRNDVDLIYEYVRNTIEYYPIWGTQKGALGAVLDSQGTTFDQAALMVELLRQSGYTASYFKGVKTLTGAQVASWLGISTSNACGAINLVRGGGMPHNSVPAVASNPCTGNPGPLQSLSINHVWVKVVIGGTPYFFDPSYKPHTIKAGINLPAASGYNAASFLSDALSGATYNDNSILGINRTNIRTRLTTYASTLAATLRQSHPAAALEDVIGGKVVVPHDGAQLRLTQAPGLDAASVTEEWTGDIPAIYKPVYQFSFNGISGSATSDVVYGHRLTVTFNALNQPELRYNGGLVATGSAMQLGTSATATITVTHPYVGGESGFVYNRQFKYTAGATYFLTNGWGPTTRGLVEYMRGGMDAARAAGSADASEPVLGSAMGVLGASWMAQATSAADITGRLAQTSFLFHHRVGLAAYGGATGSSYSAPFVDLPGNVQSLASEVADSAKEQAAYYSSTMRSSIFESTAVQQTTGGSAVSTVKLFDIHAAASGSIFWNVNASLWPGVKAALQIDPRCSSTSQGVSVISQIEAIVSTPGGRVVVPSRCDITEAQWRGAGFFTFVPAAGGSTALGASISPNLAGGFASSPQAAATTVSNAAAFTLSDDFLKQFTGLVFGDPIDMVKGNYLYSHADITTGIGEFPYSLGLQRLYSSGTRTNSGPMGLGWTHNFAASMAVGSDGFQGLGEDSALDAVPTLVEQLVALDLLSDPAQPLTKMVIATLGQAWLGEQLVNNTVIVRQGLNGEVFVKLPDGTYNPPRGNSAKLTLSGGLYTYETVNKARMNFNAANRIASYVHPSGVEARFSYVGNDLSQVQNSFGRTLTFTTVGGRISSISDGSRSVGYLYTGNDLTTFTDATSQSTTFQYDIPGRLWRLFYPSNPSIAFLTNTYDSLGRVQTQTNANGKLYTYFFAGTRSEELGPPLSGASPAPGARRISYLDDQGKVIKAIDPMGRVTLNSYDGQSRISQSVLPEGNRVEYEYDDAPCAAQLRCTHNVKTMRRVAKAGSGLPDLSSRFTYETAFNNLWTATDPRLQVTTNTYTAQGLPNSITSPADNSGVQPQTTYGYTAYSAPQAGFPAVYLPTSVTSKITATSSVVNTTSYNPANKLVPLTTTVDSGAGKLNLTSSFVYDAVGNLKQIDGPRTDVADITSFDYDNERRRIKTTNAINEQTIQGYDADGRPNRTARSLDPDYAGSWMVSCTSYTPTGKPLKSWGPQLTGAATACPAAVAPVPMVDFAYDDVDRLRSVTQNLLAADGGNRVTETDYFADDSVQTVRRAVGTSIAQTYAQYTYTNNGLLWTITDARNYRTTYDYDGHDRRFKVRFPDKTSINTSSTTDYEQYGFDNNGNVTTVRRRGGQSIILGYDNLNRLLSRTYTPTTDNVSFQYDLLGRRTVANKNDGHNISYVWDNAGRLLSTTAGGRMLSYYYDNAGNRTRITWPDSAFATTSFDALNRPYQIKEYDATLLATYAYFPMSLRKTVTLGNGTVTSYTYDGQGDLASLTHDLAGTAADVSFTYPRNQAREIATHTWNNDNYVWRPSPAANGSKSFVANGQNQYTTITGASPSHDGNGNLAGDGTWSYGYDPDNRLKSAAKTGYSASLAYDAEGRMRQTTLGGAVTNLLYDGEALVAEYDAAGTMLKRYIHGPGIDEPLVVYEGLGGVNPKSWLYADHLGSIIAQADGAGVSSATYKYGPFGEPDTTSGLRFRYTGQQYLGALDLYHYKARFYSHAQGRFLQTDPIGYADDLNLYSYVGNDPVNLTDPTGLCPMAADGVPCRAIYPFAGVSITSERLRNGLDAIAAAADRNLIVYSGDRDPARNAAVGGARNSAHTQGMAADVIFQGASKAETAAILYNSQTRIDAGIRLVYHMPGGKLPEHSHLDLMGGGNIQQNPNGTYSPISVLPTRLPSYGLSRLDAPTPTGGGVVLGSSSFLTGPSFCSVAGCK